MVRSPLNYPINLITNLPTFQKPESEYTKQGYLFCLEKSKIRTKNSPSFQFLNGIPFAEAFTATWAKYYCTYKKEERVFTMLQYNQISGRSESASLTDTLTLDACVRKASDFEKRFCFDLTFDQKPGVIFTFQAVSEDDRKAWLNAMDGKEPVRRID